jgi:hypothetical protein
MNGLIQIYKFYFKHFEYVIEYNEKLIWADHLTSNSK